ncbi:hypothetical protein OC513_22260, partial [Vibrio vulnificus]|nr:hypothetical protein [Vibrio vulnificus]
RAQRDEPSILTIGISLIFNPLRQRAFTAQPVNGTLPASISALVNWLGLRNGRIPHLGQK